MTLSMLIENLTVDFGFKLMTDRGYPAKRALPAMRKHGK